MQYVGYLTEMSVITTNVQELERMEAAKTEEIL